MDARDLERQGWTRRFTAAEPRLGEARELYFSLGYEVMTVPAGNEDGCSECFGEEGDPDRLRVLYTRKRSAEGEMRIDLHCHTLNSGDNLIRPRDLIREARQRGLDALAVTEHDSFDASEEAERIGREEGFPVFRSIEVTTDRGHLLLFGIGEDALDLWRRGTYADAEKVIAWAAAQGAAVVSAHPFSLRDLHAPGEAVRDIAGLSAVECLNGRCSTEENAAAELAALAMKLPRVGGSDCHKMEEIARCCTVFETPILSPGDLVREIRAGRCRPERLR